MFLQITDCGVVNKYGFKAREELRKFKCLVNSVFKKIEKHCKDSLRHMAMGQIVL